MYEKLKNDIAFEIDKIEEGLTDAYPLYVKIRDLENFLKEVVTQISEFVLDETEGQTIEFEGYQLEKRNGSKRWDFSGLSVHAKTKDKLREIEKLHKLAYERSVKGLDPLYDSETGEIIEPAGLKFSKDTVVLKKLKNL